MEKNKKLAEAKFFFDYMKRTQGDPDFTYFLSAFLAAARSVLQRLIEDKNAKRWYDKQPQDKIIKFFKCQRNINIHRRDVRQNKVIKVTDSVEISDSLTITMIDKDSQIIQEQTIPPKSLKKENETEVIVKRYFSDWPGPGDGDILMLSKCYVDKLDNLLNEARKQGVI